MQKEPEHLPLQILRNRKAEESLSFVEPKCANALHGASLKGFEKFFFGENWKEISLWIGGN